MSYRLSMFALQPVTLEINELKTICYRLSMFALQRFRYASFAFRKLVTA